MKIFYFTGTGSSIKWFVNFAKRNNITIKYADSLLMSDNYFPIFDAEKEKLRPNNIDEDLNLLISNVNQNMTYINRGKYLELFSTSITKCLLKILPNFNSVKNFSVEDNCNGCKTCAKVCPRDNITFRNDTDKSKPIYGENCEFCLACINLCPQKAIKLKRESNPNARFINENVTLKEIIDANN